jgi:glycosyltransferase involved in cell wall biosynthesis
MSEGQQDTVTAKELIKPVVFIDRETVRKYSPCLRRLLVGLTDQAYSSAVVCPPGVNVDPVTCPSVQVIQHPVFKTFLLFRQNKHILLESLEKFGPTVLHCYCRSKMNLTKKIAQQMNLPYVITFNSLLPKYCKPSVSSTHCGALIASSNKIVENLTDLYSRFSDQVEHINVSTFVEDTCACFSDPTQLASLVLAQRLDNSLDFDPLLSAVRHLAIDGYEFVLAVIGKGPAEREIHRRIRSLGLTQIVTVVPGMEPLRSVFSGADIFIHCQSGLECNSHLLEAMGVGMAVAACRDGVDDLLIEDQTAIFFDRQDELSIYNALKKLLGTREFAKQIALAGQTHLRKHHSVSRMTQALIQTYKKSQNWYKDKKTEVPDQQLTSVDA